MSTKLQITNEEIAKQLQELADLLEIKGVDFFRIRAYRQAVEAIAELTQSLAEMVEQGKDLSELPGIGESIAQKIITLVQTGSMPQLDKLRQEYPPELLKLTRIENLGPKRVGKLFRELKIVSITDLKAAINDGRLLALEGFGEKLVSEIAQDLERASFEENRVLWADAEKMAEPLLAFLKTVPGVKQVEIAGSYRRKKETVGDFDLLATGDHGEKIIEAFLKYSEIKKVMMEGETRATVILKTGMQLDLRVVPEKSYGAALQYFTGSKAHGIATRRLAIEKGLKLNEYGLYQGDTLVAGETEESIYHSLGLPFIRPELREDRGELQAAAAGKLPILIEPADILGDFQCHSTWSDGSVSIEEMAHAAQATGLKYMLMTDHSKYIGITFGMTDEDVEKYCQEIDTVNKKLKHFTVLKGVEVDILADGSLALKDETLKKLDIVVAAVHSHFKLDRASQTKRLLSAISNPHVDIIGHPTGRIIGQRSGYESDVEAVVLAAKKYGKVLEINAQPSRVDLDDKWAKFAKDQGVKLVISTDSHAPDQYQAMKYGVYQAQRAWLEKDDILNCLSAEKVVQFFAKE